MEARAKREPREKSFEGAVRGQLRTVARCSVVHLKLPPALATFSTVIEREKLAMY